MSTTPEALALADDLSTAALLRDAIGVLRARGWATDTFVLDPEDGTPADQWPVCAVGAISVAHGGQPHEYMDSPITRALLAINRRFLLLAVDEAAALDHRGYTKDLMLAIGKWNDSLYDVDEVIDALERIAVALEAGQLRAIPPDTHTPDGGPGAADRT